MSSDIENAKLSHVVRAWAATARRELGAHPDNDQLLAYYDGELQTKDEESLRNHLALCPECSQRGLELKLFSQAELAESYGLAIEEAELNGARPQILEKAFPVSQVQGDLRPTLWPRFTTWISYLKEPRLAHAASAFFLACSLGLSVQLMHARAELEMPRTDVQRLDLLPMEAGRFRGAGDPPWRVGVSQSAPLLVNLYLLNPGQYLSYRVEIMDSTGSGSGMVWSTDDLQRLPEDDFMVFLPPDVLAEGEYRIRLYGIKSDDPDLLAEYELQVDG